ncbi:MAG: DNA polymerase III subunit chi [Aestuariivita sp.]|nr:DNA polymerase III subunit chi [Aestuariivita sp.]
MVIAIFYHLKRNSLETALKSLLIKSLAARLRIAVRSNDLVRLKRIDDWLWTHCPTDFIPHMLASGSHIDQSQPILLTTGIAYNNPSCLIGLNAVDIDVAEVMSMQKVSLIFEGKNADELKKLRLQWKVLTDAGCSAQYWSDETGKWEMKA